ncbi:hypothetical protein KAFR_0I00440 [Kazachstania africana CBS 2517]|uniref:Lysophospholipase NTE1 n=1 Tax=Kazachstania africana (strain ATCC 22294 / BCRC 22015 / CBS 2517 / CECT 1963 / NBRC 1671 / NRRL Y-8276) TaxID=1071382 RepID=H2AZM5_KAZAF|nr:hypothetical protein KAFR_0I00440 [Kazachstania africana CBS 2517]CCF59825.1 hypothetical protein KAFR_0I00440 [Kazachstania africana CBS 2517]
MDKDMMNLTLKHVAFQDDVSNDSIVKASLRLSYVSVKLLVDCIKLLVIVTFHLVSTFLKLPTWVFLSGNRVQLTISFSAFIVLIAVVTYIIYGIVRNRVLSQYKKLTPDFDGSFKSNVLKKKKVSPKHPNDGHKKEKKKRAIDIANETFLSSYLDEFLSAIKIFGYLEKPVFHDLTKNMKKQKLDEGEILLLGDLDSSLGFAIVVEGTLQIFHEIDQQNDFDDYESEKFNNGVDFDFSSSKNLASELISSTLNKSDIESISSSASSDFTDDSNDSYLGNSSNEYITLKGGLGKFQLLNTVKSGNPVSSLVNILNLFTSPVRSSNSSGSDRYDSNDINQGLTNYSLSAMKNELTQTPRETPASISSPLDKQIAGILPLQYTPPTVVARAATDCTIAIIPPHAFTTLTSKYPRSTSHIIQMILNKLYHVTFQTAHQYLGLTNEIMTVERSLNKSSNYEIPYYLKEAAIRKLKHSIENDTELPLRKNKESYQGKIQSHNRHRFVSPDNSNETILERPPLTSSSSRKNVASSFLSSRHVVLDSRDHLNPGDLLSNVPLSRKEINLEKDVQNKPRAVKSGSSSTGIISPESNVSNINVVKNPLSPSISSDKKKNKHNFISSNLNATTTFSSTQDETEESAVRMALTEAMFNYLGIQKDIVTSDLGSSLRSKSNFSNGLTSTPHRSSELSLTNSVASYHTGYPNLRILPSNYAITAHKVKKAKKKDSYKEEVPSNLDFESAKNEFAQNIELLHFKQGSIIVKQNCSGKGLFYVISGKIKVTTSSNFTEQSFAATKPTDLKENRTLYYIETGGIAGYLSCLVGYRSFVNLEAKTDVYVGFLANEVIDKLYDKYFLIYLHLAEKLTSLLTPKLMKLDHALEWVHLSASDILFRQEEPANGIYVVLNGRLRQYQSHDSLLEEKYDDDDDTSESKGNEDTVLTEIPQGESFGEVEVLTASNRLSTIVAVRDSELARIPRSLFESLVLEHPSIMIRVSRLVAKKIMGQYDPISSSDRITSERGYKYDFNLTIPSTHAHSYNVGQTNQFGFTPYRTITIIPITPGLPVESFAHKLVNAFKQVGRTTIGLNQKTTLLHLGRHAFDKLAKLKQSGYFSELEQSYETVVYIADTSVNSSWTKTCIDQGDCILLLADARSRTDIGEYEKLLLESKTTARTELILLHPEKYVEPGLTQKWLRYRPWVHSHHHMQFLVNTMEDDTMEDTPATGTGVGLIDKITQNEFSKKTQLNISRLLPDSIKMKVESFSSRFMGRKRQYYSSIHSHKSDFLRLARILSGQAVGLVLGGGGARGISHLGVLQALDELGIPVDIIGGTSIGSFIGGLYAKDYDVVPIYGRIKKFAGRISSIWRMISDLTWPVTSYTTGHEFNRGIWKTFGDTRIEDFWLQYYCNSTNITESVQEIHSFGYAWRYIRASMSLAGLLPPLEENGSMLLDGGYVDNLPVLEMKARGCDTIFAVDVGSVDDRTPMKYGDSLNGFWIVFNRWNPFSSHPNIPNMAEIQMRLGYVSSVNALEKAKQTKGVIYARPPIEGYNTLDFAKFEEIYKVGAAYGRAFFQELIQSGKMPYIPGSKNSLMEPRASELLLQRRNSI